MRLLFALLLLVFPTWAMAGPLVTETFSGDSDAGSGRWALKLNTYAIDQAVRLVDFAPWLDPGSSPAEVRFLVYKFSHHGMLAENWSQVAAEDRTVSGGAGFKPSPVFSIDLEAGETYALGVLLLGDGDINYRYDDDLPESVSWGTLNGSLTSVSYTSYTAPNTLIMSRWDFAYYQQVTVEIYEDLDGDGFDERTDCDDNDPLVYPGAPERCNGIDDDCNELIDDEVVYIDTWVDADGDGYGDPDQLVPSCNGVEPGHADNPDDCDDSDPLTYPGAPERCDGKDNDCDDIIDNDVVDQIWYYDADNDGFGDPDITVETCDGPPVGYVAHAGDCDDEDPTAYPGAPELCDGVDNDCNGQIDDEVEYTDWYADRDQDGFGTPDEVMSTCDGPPEGYVDNADDCDDMNSTVYPGAPELCDGLDNDCDGVVIGEEDSDGDGYLDCEDCAPDDPEIHPGAIERCDGIDRNCDGFAPTSQDCDPYGDEQLGSGCGCQTSSGMPAGMAGVLTLLGMAAGRRGRRRG